MSVPSLPAGYFKDTAVIYTANPSTGAGGGRFDVQGATVQVRLTVQSTRYAMFPTAQERAELTKRRDMFWSSADTIPEGSELAIGADRWNMERGSTIDDPWVDGTPVLRHCTVVRVGT